MIIRTWKSWAMSLIAVAFVLVCLPAFCEPAGEMVSDVIIGHSNRGPYYLTWSNISKDALSVSLNGRMLRAGSDYNLDNANGVLSFNAILLQDAIVRVSYYTIPGKSAKASRALNLPVSLSVLSNDKNSLKLVGLFAQDATSKSDSGKTIVGIDSANQVGSTNVSTQFLMSQKNDGSATTGDSAAMDRAMYKIGASSNIGALKLTGSMLNTGTSFLGGKEYGVALGKRATDFGLAFSPDKTISLSAKMQTSEDTAGANKGANTTVNSQNLLLSPADSTRISLAHTQTDTHSSAQSQGTVADTSVLKLDQSIGQLANVSASVQNDKVTSGSTSDETQTRQVAVNAAASGVNVQANLFQQDSASKGTSDALNVGASVKPNDQFKLDLKYGQANNNTVGTQSNQAVSIAVAPIAQVSLTASVATVDSSKLGQSSQSNVGVAVNPLNSVFIKGNFAQTTKGDDLNFQRDVSLSANPVSFATVTAAFAQKGGKNVDDVTKSAALTLTPIANTKVGAAIRQTDNGVRQATITDYSASSAACRFVTFNGKMRLRQYSDNPDQVSQWMDMAFMPLSNLALNGGYQFNPETDKGDVQILRTTSVGMKMQVGSVAVKTNLSARDEYMLGRQSLEQGVGLDVPFFRAGLLTTGVKRVTLQDGSESGSTAYSLGYKRDLGSSFNLSLQGYFTQYFQNSKFMPDKDELKAEANLSMGF